MNTTATMPVEIPASINRPCDDCGQLVASETIVVFGHDLTAGLPVCCETCFDAREKREIEQQKKREAAKRESEWERIVAKHYRATDVENPDFNSALWRALAHWSIDDGWLGIIGPAGHCKTRTLALLIRRHIFAGRPAEWTTASRFQWAAQREFDDHEGPEARRWLHRWKSTGLLIFDDLGKQRWTDTVESHFFDLVDTRLAHERPIWWTANTHPEDMIAAKQLTKDRGAPIVGRLLEASRIVDLSIQQQLPL